MSGTWTPHASRESWEGQQRHATNEISIMMSRKLSNGVVKRQRKRQNAVAAAGTPKQKAFATVLAASLLSQIYSGESNTTTAQQSGSRQQVAEGNMGGISDSGAHHRASTVRGDPCGFRTRLLDGDSFASDEMFMSTDDLTIGRIKFDDTECIKVHRSLGRFGNQVQKRSDVLSTPADLIGPGIGEGDCGMNIDSAPAHGRFGSNSVGNDRISHCLSIVSSSASAEGIDMDDSKDVSYPFWPIPPRHRKHRNFPFRDRHPAPDTDGNIGDELSDDDDDDMSIISDVSLIPSYSFNDDITRQQQCARARTLFKQLIKAKAKTARQTVRILKRSCLEAMEHAFVDHHAYRPAKCVSVGEVY